MLDFIQIAMILENSFIFEVKSDVHETFCEDKVAFRSGTTQVMHLRGPLISYCQVKSDIHELLIEKKYPSFTFLWQFFYHKQLLHAY